MPFRTSGEGAGGRREAERELTEAKKSSGSGGGKRWEGREVREESGEVREGGREK